MAHSLLIKYKNWLLFIAFCTHLFRHWCNWYCSWPPKSAWRVPTDCGKASVLKVPRQQSKKKLGESSKNEKKKNGRGKDWVGLSLQISSKCTRMRYTQSYLLALPNKTTDVIIVFLLCRVGPTTTDHHRVFQLTKLSLRRFSNFLIIWRMQSFPYIIPFIGFLWQLCCISGMWIFLCVTVQLQKSFFNQIPLQSNYCVLTNEEVAPPAGRFPWASELLRCLQ